MRARREFSIACQVAIIQRATDSSGRVHCERCGVWCKSRKDYEIDHVLPEGMRPSADLKRKLVAADGRVLCRACHPQKTRRDQGDIAEAKRREAAALSVVRPGKRRIWWRSGRDQRPPLRVAAGVPRLAREGFVPAGRK
jgi:hypothetical protein